MCVFRYDYDCYFILKSSYLVIKSHRENTAVINPKVWKHENKLKAAQRKIKVRRKTYVYVLHRGVMDICWVKTKIQTDKHVDRILDITSVISSFIYHLDNINSLYRGTRFYHTIYHVIMQKLTKKNYGHQSTLHVEPQL